MACIQGGLTGADCRARLIQGGVMEKDDASVPIDGAALDRLMLTLWLGLAIAIASVAAANLDNFAAALGIGALIMLAAFAGGCFFGFLFGVPRVLSQPAASDNGHNISPGGSDALRADGVPSRDAPAGPVPPTTGSRLLQSNTNLERISDWLTTMLVGAGLVELHKLNEALLGFRNFLEANARVFTTANGQLTAGALPAIGPIVLVFGAACGFLYMYLNTRLVLVLMFHAVETRLAGKLGATAQRAVRAVINDSSTLSNFIQQQYSAKRSLTVQDAISLMFDLLYKDDPGRVIELGAQLSGTEAVNRADYWFYLAAAFGQRLHGLKKVSDEWQSNRDNALDCARRAVAIDSSYRQRLWRISDARSSDNDLAPLRDDPEFIRIVGQGQA